MNTKTLLTVKTDKTLKENAGKVAHELGIPLGTLVNSFLAQLVRTGKIEFSTHYTPSDYLVKSIKQTEKEIASKKTLGAKNLDELFNDLDN